MKKIANGILHITNHSGKMVNIQSISTNNLDNDFCKRLSKCSKLICSKCYANKLLTLRPNVENKMDINSKLLSEALIPYRELPKFNALYVRFNSFGELINLIHLKNLIRICNNNKRTTFTLFTKRNNLIDKILNKPRNLILIYSNPIMNKVLTKLPNNFNKVFNVVDSDYIRDNQTLINCQKSCFTCLKCYNTRNREKIIIERLK